MTGQAARPVYGNTGLWITVAFAIVAPASGLIVLAAFLWMKWNSDPLVIWASLIGITFISIGDVVFLRRKRMMH
ncbi:hypothetical protein ACQ5ES_09455 [Pseudidiomarina sp. E22-M8]|uniref:hypothetical protein n=1 Tax=Pseudidiomarina sp. E22-M8 TaxID=3424768 RepID=UPI00403CB4CD